MGRCIDVDELIDATVVAELIGVRHRNSVRVYRTRYPDFPEPVVDMGSGRCLLWARGDIVAWQARRSLPR